MPETFLYTGISYRYLARLVEPFSNRQVIEGFDLAPMLLFAVMFCLSIAVYKTYHCGSLAVLVFCVNIWATFRNIGRLVVVLLSVTARRI